MRCVRTWSHVPAKVHAIITHSLVDLLLEARVRDHCNQASLVVELGRRLQSEMENALIKMHSKVKAESARRQEIAREVARLEISTLYAHKIAGADAEVKRIKEELRALDARVRWPKGQRPGKGPSPGGTLGSLHGDRVRTKQRLERAQSGASALEDSVLGVSSASPPPGRVYARGSSEVECA